MAEFDFVTRYGSNLNDLPDVHTMCLDQCEGTGWVPIGEGEMEEPWRSLWLAAEAEKPTDDGYHFVKCPSCDGTGKRKAA